MDILRKFHRVICIKWQTPLIIICLVLQCMAPVRAAEAGDQQAAPVEASEPVPTGEAAQEATAAQGATAAQAAETSEASEPADPAATAADSYQSTSDILPDNSRSGSLTIRFVDPETGEPDKFGNKVGIYKVADFKVEDGCRLVYDELFASVGDPPTRDAQLNAELAALLNETAEIKGISLDAPSEEVWSDGAVTFRGLNAGLYLVVQTYRVSASEKSVIEPFLAMLPVRKADGTLDYDVSVVSGLAAGPQAGPADDQAGATDDQADATGSPGRKPGSADQLDQLARISDKDRLPRVGGVISYAAEMLAIGLAIIVAAVFSSRRE